MCACFILPTDRQRDLAAKAIDRPMFSFHFDSVRLKFNILFVKN